MKFQPKRFIVEVKRGTNRAAFVSADASTERFSSAEALLFGGATKVAAETAQPALAIAEAPRGRILRSLVEPPAPVVEDLPEPVRRGRKPGSKNKPKPQPPQPSAATGGEPPAERPRRGRKPGSKNKPKPQLATSFPPSTDGRSSIAAAMRSYGFVDDGTVWAEAAPASPARPAPAASDGEAGTDVRGRPRLRDRSVILRRYVLEIEPRPGQPGSLRARRLARAAS